MIRSFYQFLCKLEFNLILVILLNCMFTNLVKADDQSSELISRILEINFELDSLQTEKEIQAKTTKNNPNSYLEFLYMLSSRQEGILYALGVNWPSRAEQEAKNRISYTKNDSNKIESEIVNLISEQKELFDIVYKSIQWENIPKVIELEISCLQNQILRLYSDKKINSEVNQPPFPGAYSNYITETEKIFPSSVRVAQYHGQVNTNKNSTWRLRKNERELDDKIDKIKDEIALLKMKIDSHTCVGLFI